MAILNLFQGQEKYLKDLICRDNPDLIEFPDSFFTPIGNVIENQDGTCSVYIRGEPGTVEEQQISGRTLVTYRRISLTDWLKSIPRGLYVNTPTTVHQLIPLIEEQYGLVFDPDVIHNDLLSGEETGTALIRFTFSLERSFILDSVEFELQWEKPRTVRLKDLFTVSALSGHIPEIQQPAS